MLPTAGLLSTGSPTASIISTADGERSTSLAQAEERQELKGTAGKLLQVGAGDGESPVTPGDCGTYVTITNLRDGFDPGKADGLALGVDRLVNEEGAVDVPATALGPLLTVKGLHAHPDFHTTRERRDHGQSSM